MLPSAYRRILKHKLLAHALKVKNPELKSFHFSNTGLPSAPERSRQRFTSVLSG